MFYRLKSGSAFYCFVDDAMAILAAFNSPEVEVVGLTTVFGNVYTQTATRNAFKILQLAEATQVMVIWTCGWKFMFLVQRRYL